jgi:hypothetical protein
MLWVTPNPLTQHKHFGGANWALSHIGINTKAAIWIGIPTVVINLLVAAILSPLLRGRGAAADDTDESDYHVEADGPGSMPVPLSAAGST